MSLSDYIYLRKSCRDYADDILDDPLSNFKPKTLTDNSYHYEVLKRDEVKLRTPWSAPHYLALYSENEGLYLENIGFVFQQACLYLQSIGIGNCWVGMGEPKDKKDNFIILISFGKSDNLTRNISEFKRKDFLEICDVPDERLKAARYAPSAINSQPWYFRKVDDDVFDVFQVKQNIIKRQILKNLNRIDMGISLAHMYVSNEKTFEFQVNKTDDINGYTYTGTIKI